MKNSDLAARLEALERRVAQPAEDDDLTPCGLAVSIARGNTTQLQMDTLVDLLFDETEWTLCEYAVDQLRLMAEGEKIDWKYYPDHVAIGLLCTPPGYSIGHLDEDLRMMFSASLPDPGRHASINSFRVQQHLFRAVLVEPTAIDLREYIHGSQEHDADEPEPTHDECLSDAESREIECRMAFMGDAIGFGYRGATVDPRLRTCRAIQEEEWNARDDWATPEEIEEALNHPDYDQFCEAEARWVVEGSDGHRYEFGYDVPDMWRLADVDRLREYHPCGHV